MAVQHPYLPKDLKLPHYKPNDKGVLEILSIFFGFIGVFVLATWIFSGLTKKPRFSFCQRLVLCWFMMCGLIHTILEGYFGLFHETLAGDMSFLGQTWKEYSMGDSRYLSSDSFVVCMERITAVVDGPLSFLTVFLYFRNSPYRYVVQLIVSLCQLYGDSLYYLTEVYEGFRHGQMYHPQYFWFYFVTMNTFWIVIPFCLILQSVGKLARCQTIADRQGGGQSKGTKNNKKNKSKEKQKSAQRNNNKKKKE